MSNVLLVEEKIYKTPIYVRKAVNDYHERNKDKAEYKEKRRIYLKKYYEKTKQKKFPIIDIVESIKV